jgi:hypothetical protein
MSQADFRTDLAYAEAARLRLEANFYPQVCRDERFVALERSDGSIYIQRHCHVDCIVAAKSGGSATVEEKIVRWKGRQYSAIAVETHSNLERTGAEDIGDGWIATSVADFLLYAFQQEDGSLLVWLFHLPQLRTWFGGAYSKYTVADTKNDRYTTRCRVVPLEDIPPECIRLRGQVC